MGYMYCLLLSENMKQSNVQNNMFTMAHNGLNKNYVGIYVCSLKFQSNNPMVLLLSFGTYSLRLK